MFSCWIRWQIELVCHYLQITPPTITSWPDAWWGHRRSAIYIYLVKRDLILRGWTKRNNRNKSYGRVLYRKWDANIATMIYWSHSYGHWTKDSRSMGSVRLYAKNTLYAKYLSSPRYPPFLLGMAMGVPACCSCLVNVLLIQHQSQIFTLKDSITYKLAVGCTLYYAS